LRRWWGQRTWPAKIALVAALLAGLLFGASMAITWLQEAFVTGYTPPELLFSDFTALDEVGLYAFLLSGVALLVAIGSALVAGLLAAARGLRQSPHAA
jgi:hypothetical protein